MASIRKQKIKGKVYYSLIERVKIKDKWRYKTLESYGTKLPKVNDIRIIKGFAEEEIKKLPDNSVDLIIIDPPYGIDYNTNHRKDLNKNLGKITLDNKKIFKTFPIVIQECFRVLKNNSALYCFCRWDTLNSFKEIIERYFNIKNNLIWVKNNWSMGDLKGSYAGQYENILFCVKGKHKLNNGRATDILKFDRVAGNSLLHSHQKPIELLNFLIKKSTKPNGVVMDCYMGSGSTIISAVGLGRGSIGIELNDKYLEIVNKRLEKECYNKVNSIEWKECSQTNRDTTK